MALTQGESAVQNPAGNGTEFEGVKECGSAREACEVGVREIGVHEDLKVSVGLLEEVCDLPQSLLVILAEIPCVT